MEISIAIARFSSKDLYRKQLLKLLVC